MSENMPQQLGNYRLLRLIGRGGFADVYLGQHVLLQTFAAIKVLQTRLTGEDQQKFYNEALTIARLTHPHIVRVLDFGVDSASNTPYLVTDYASAGTLRQLYPRGARVPRAAIVKYVRQVASALQYAHDQHIIHRDVKPENMLVEQNGDILLTDFGIALVTQSSRYQTTQEVVGTVLYMAPEQLQGKARPASDQYALGIVVYEWLTGERPFHGSFAEVGSQHMFAPPPPMHGKAPDISLDIEQVVLTALAKDPLQRFASISAFANALEQACTDTMRVGPSRHFLTPPAPVQGNSGFERTFIPTPPLGPSLANTAEVVPSRKWSERLVTRRGLLVGAVAVATVAGSAALLAHALNPNLFSNSGVSYIPHTTPTLTHGVQPQISPTLSPTGQPTNIVTPRPGPTKQPTVQPTTRPTSQPTTGPTTQPTTQPTTGPTQQPTTQPTTGPTPQPTTQPTTGPTQQPTTQPTTSPGVGTDISQFTGQSGQIYIVSWSPDGTGIASGANDTTVAVWNASNGTGRFSYRGHSAPVYALAWSPNGQFIASGGSDGTVQIWNAINGNPILTYNGHTGSVNAVAWSPDSSTIASAGNDMSVQVWDAMSKSLHFRYNHGGAVRCVAWSRSSGQYIVSGGDDGKALVVSASNGNTINSYGGHSGTIWGVAWSPDNTQVVSGSDDRTAQVWNFNGSIPNIKYTQHSSTVTSVDWSSTHIASASNDNTAQIWDASSGTTLYIYRKHTAGVSTVRWSPDGRNVVSAGQDGVVRVWQGA